jgi:hypothetical protein
MAVGPTALKLAGAAGTLVVCGASGLAVAADTKPGAAPLKPPVSGAAASTPPPATQTDAAAGLVIPASGTCAQPAGRSGSGGGTAARPSLPPVPTGLQAAVQQYAKATTAQQRQQVLTSLSADERMQLTAYLQQVAQARSGGQGSRAGGAGMGLSCLGAGQQGASGSTDISPAVVDGQQTAPIAVSAVS